MTTNRFGLKFIDVEKKEEQIRIIAKRLEFALLRRQERIIRKNERMLQKSLQWRF